MQGTFCCIFKVAAYYSYVIQKPETEKENNTRDFDVRFTCVYTSQQHLCNLDVGKNLSLHNIHDKAFI